MKQMVTLLTVPCIYVFRIAYEKEETTWTELNTMIVIVGGTIWFIASDHTQVVINNTKPTLRMPTQYAEGSDEEDLLMSWKEADEVTKDDLRISNKDEKNHGDGIIVDSHQQAPTTAAATDTLTLK